MELEGNNSVDVQSLYDLCKKMMYYHTVLRMKDGTEVDGIVIGAELDHVDVLMGEDVIYREDENPQDRNPEDGSSYNRQRPYGRPRRVRRFRRRRFPLAELLALSLLPYPYNISPYPYISAYPTYPTYPYYPY